MKTAEIQIFDIEARLSEVEDDLEKLTDFVNNVFGKAVEDKINYIETECKRGFEGFSMAIDEIRTVIDKIREG